MNNQPKPAEIVIMVSGVVAFLSIFLEWYGNDFGLSESGLGKVVFPFGAFIGLIGLVQGLQVVLAKFANMSFPDAVLGFTWPQIHFVLSLIAGVLALSFLIQSVPGADKGIGLWLGFLGAVGLVVGSVMQLLDSERAPSSAAPPTPF